MKKLTALLVLIAILVQYAWQELDISDKQEQLTPISDSEVTAAFEQQQSDIQVLRKGTVKTVLSDDNEGSRHQRFILRLESGQTLLVAHNIDLAPRIDSLRTGDSVEFFGEYEWNSMGGVIHWTHHDPRGAHVDGWLKHKGQIYK